MVGFTRPDVGKDGEVKLAGLPLMLVPGSWKVEEPPRFGDKLSIGALKYTDFNPFESAQSTAYLTGGYGLRRYSDLDATSNQYTQMSSVSQAISMYAEAHNVDARFGPIILSGKQVVETLPGSAHPPVWSGEFTPSGGTRTWVVVTQRKVFTRAVGGIWTDTGIVLPSDALRGAVGVFGGNLVIGFGSASTAVFTNNLTSTSSVVNDAGPPAPLYVFAFSSDRASSYIAGGTATTDVHKVMASLTGASYQIASTTPCGGSDSKITAIAPGGGLDTVFVGKETELGAIDNNGIYRTLVPFDSSLSTNCLLGGARIAFRGDPLGVSRRWYDGEVIEITTSSNRILTGTPNHPIAALRGWVPLRLLNEGDEVLIGKVAHALAGSSTDEQDMDPTFEEIYRSSTYGVTPKRIAGRTVDFHGDGQSGEINVVRPHRGLLGKVVSSEKQATPDVLLQSSHFEQDSLLGDSSSMQFLGTGLSSPSRSLGFLGKGSSLLLRKLCHAKERILAAGSNRYPQMQQSPFDRSPVHPVTDSQGREPLPPKVATSETLRIGGKPLSPSDGFGPREQRNPQVLQGPGHRPTGNPVAESQSTNGDSTQIITDKVIRIVRKPFSGHVYNLETTTGDYYANGILSHNCLGMRWWLGAGADEQRGPLILVFPRDRSIWAYEPSSQTAGKAENVSPWSQPQIRPPTVRGRISAIQGTARWLYYAITNSAGESWLAARDARTGANHASLLDFGAAANTQMLGITSLFGNPMLFAGIGNNLISVVLPLDGEVPFDDSGCSFVLNGTIDLPDMDLGFPDEDKVLLLLRVTADGLVAGAQTIKVYVNYDGGDFTPLGIAETSPFVEIPFDSNIVAKRVGIRLKLITTSPALTPKLLGVSVRMSLNTRLYRQWSFSAMVPPGVSPSLSDMLNSPYSDIRSLWAAREAGVPVTFIDRWNDVWKVRIRQLAEREVYKEIDRTPESAIDVQLLQVATGQDVSTSFVAPNGSALFFPLSFPWSPFYSSVMSSTRTVNIQVGGGTPYPRWTITGPGFYPTLTGPLGETFILNYELTAGEVVTINMAPTRKTVISSSVGDISDRVVIGSRFWQLQNGDNTVTIGMGRTSAVTGAIMTWDSLTTY